MLLLATLSPPVRAVRRQVTAKAVLKASRHSPSYVKSLQQCSKLLGKSAIDRKETGFAFTAASSSFFLLFCSSLFFTGFLNKRKLNSTDVQYDGVFDCSIHSSEFVFESGI